MTELWEVIAVKRHKSGELKSILAYDWLAPMTERQARKMAWACDVWGDREMRVRPVGEDSIGVPHEWTKHAPPAFFASFAHG